MLSYNEEVSFTKKLAKALGYNLVSIEAIDAFDELGGVDLVARIKFKSPSGELKKSIIKGFFNLETLRWQQKKQMRINMRTITRLGSYQHFSETQMQGEYLKRRKNAWKEKKDGKASKEAVRTIGRGLSSFIKRRF